MARTTYSHTPSSSLARPRHLPLLPVLCLLAGSAAAQTTPADQQITVTGLIHRNWVDVGGFGDVPLARTPLAATVIETGQLADAGARSLSDLTRFDAAIGDAYNAEGYWQTLMVRGFALDNRANYRRDGLPINAETVIPLENKSGLEILKGISGIQAGVSAPGGLANFIVKRPTRDLASVGIEWREQGTVGASADISRRFGVDGVFGLRVNAAAEHLDPKVRHADGDRHVGAIAGDWRVAPDTLLEVEFETSRQSQPSVPGFSLLGNRLPSAQSIDPRINLNDQPWSQPVVFKGDTGSVRLRQNLAGDWRFTAHAMQQSLVTDDRVAFPFGCTAEDNFDRYCSDGSFDLYDFRSDSEHRRSRALDLSFAGSAHTGNVEHRLAVGALSTRFRSRLQGQAYNFVGTGTIDGNTVVPADPTLAYTNTNRDERSTEWYLRDAMQLTARWSLWAGVRHSKLHRASVETDGSAAVSYQQSFTTPWASLAYQLAPKTMLYASWGEGVETDVVPNKAGYLDRGQPLKALKSRQTELGIKHDSESFAANLALFDIRRPAVTDTGSVYATDGEARHRGLETMASWRTGPWQLHGTAMLLQARRRHATLDPTLDDQRPVNVPDHTLRLTAAYDVAPLPGLALMGTLVAEGKRAVLPDNSVFTPGWGRVDLGARYQQRLDNGTQLTWRVGVDNVADKRAWKEAPYQYGHAYLFPLAPRTWRVALQAAL